MDTQQHQSRAAQALFLVFAHNNETVIDGFVRSLAAAIERAGPKLGPCAVEVLANGCTDRSASVAEAAGREVAREGLSVHVEEIQQGGKANAWQHGVHVVSQRYGDPEFLVFVDSDIDLSETDLGDLVSLLRNDTHALAVTSRPVKRHVPLSVHTIVPYLTSRSGQTHRNGAVCGQLYVARGSFLRRIWMPRGLLVEDGFVAACLRTRLFTQEPDDTLIVAHPRVRHFFEVERSLSDAVRHEQRTELGSHMNFVAFPELWRAEPNAESFLRSRYAEDPDWLLRDFEETMISRGARTFRWSRILDPFIRLRPSKALPLSGMAATARAVQRALALVGAYTRATRHDFRW